MQNDEILDWDRRKRIQNMARHGLDFHDLSGFDWDSATLRRSNRFGEEQFLAINRFKGKIYAVVYTRRDSSRRIISFRRANRNEATEYENR